MKYSGDINGNRTSDLPACCSLPQPSAPLCAPQVCLIRITVTEWSGRFLKCIEAWLCEEVTPPSIEVFSTNLRNKSLKKFLLYYHALTAFRWLSTYETCSLGTCQIVAWILLNLRIFRDFRQVLKIHPDRFPASNHKLFATRNAFKRGDGVTPLLFNFVLYCTIRRFQVKYDSLKFNGMSQVWFVLVMLIYWPEAYIL